MRSLNDENKEMRRTEREIKNKVRRNANCENIYSLNTLDTTHAFYAFTYLYAHFSNLKQNLYYWNNAQVCEFLILLFFSSSKVAVLYDMQVNNEL